MQEKIQTPLFHSQPQPQDISEKGEHLLKESLNATRAYTDPLFGTAFGFFSSILACLALLLIGQQIYHIWTCQKRRAHRVPIIKVDWKPDVVYLFQFPRAQTVPNTSPHCLKLETFLRHHKLPHEVIESMVLRSAEGNLPFVELNGIHHADLQLIICHLTKHFGLEAAEELSEAEKGMVRAISRMLDNGTFYQLLYSKLGKNITKFYEVNLEGHAPKFLKWLSVPLVYPQVWDKLNFEGTGLHSEQEVEMILRADLKALDGLLGDKSWLVGDRPTLADFTFFGHIAATYNLPYALPIQRMLDEEFPRLRALHDRIARAYFPEFKFGRIGPEQQMQKED